VLPSESTHLNYKSPPKSCVAIVPNITKKNEKRTKISKSVGSEFNSD